MNQVLKPNLTPWRYLLALGALFLAYFLTARIGLQIEPVNTFATFVWPPTGIALAALLLFDRRLWLGVFLGAFVVNWSFGATWIVALAIGAGNTLEVVVAAYLLRRFGFHNTIDRVRDVLQLIFFGALTSTTIAATIGVSALWLSGVVDPVDYARTWQAWWMGDALGMLVVAPILLTMFARRSLGQYRRAGLAEGVLLTVVFIVTNTYIFGDLSTDGTPGVFAPASYVLLVPILWTALRFGQPAASTSILLTSGYAIWATIRGLGPFAQIPDGLELLYLQIFIGAASATGMIIAANVAELENAKKVLRAVNERKDEFLALLAHELRNPLAAISSSVELAELQDEKSEPLGVIKRHSTYITRLLEDLLDVSRISYGKITLRPEIVDARAAAADAVEATRTLMESHKIELVVSQPNEPLWVNADPTRLEQIMANLLSNAAKYTDPEGQISLTLARSGKMVIIEVKDSGIGIPADSLKDIFTAFAQVKETVSRSRGGLGLGLKLVKSLTELHGGRVYAESEGAGKGSRFIVHLPAASAPPDLVDEKAS
jgi:signal transduction histidine kinase